MRTSASATSDGECVVPLCVDVCGMGEEGDNTLSVQWVAGH